MKTKALTSVLIAIGLSILLGATVFRDQIAQAAGIVSANITGPLDAQGNVKTHEQGTANVNVTNATVPVHEQGSVSVSDPELEHPLRLSLDDAFASYEVPQGRALMIEYVNCPSSPIIVNSGICILSVHDSLGNFTQYKFPLGPSDPYPGFSGLVRIYVPAGNTISNGRPDSAGVNLIGFTFDLPGR
jgi:hypothetical protein